MKLHLTELLVSKSIYFSIKSAVNNIAVKLFNSYRDDFLSIAPSVADSRSVNFSSVSKLILVFLLVLSVMSKQLGRADKRLGPFGIASNQLEGNQLK